jgi:GntR family transcriptional regulator, transcriptional repressor for pyruvate dehydrogenase complex
VFDGPQDFARCTLIAVTRTGENAFVPRPIQTSTAAQQIAEQIRIGILKGQLRPGHRLPSEADLAAEYAVSRGTIRETMKLLSATQLVESSRGAGGGTFVRLPEPGRVAATIGDSIAMWFSAGTVKLKEINDARAWIERGCVRFAAVARTEHDLAAIHATIEEIEQPGIDLERMLEVDLQFHVEVSRAAHNAGLELAMSAIHLVRPFSNTMLMPYLSIEAVAAQHREIYEGIVARDVERAEAAFDRHMAYLDETRRRALEEQGAEDMPVADLLTEAHPAFEAIRERVIAPPER